MTRSLDLHPEAADEFKEAARWYASRKEGLGVAFAMAVDEALMAIAHGRRRPGYWVARQKE